MPAAFTEFPAGADRAPVVLVFPDPEDRATGDDVARWLNGVGLHAAVVAHRWGRHGWPAAMHDARDALAAMREGDTALPVEGDAVAVLGLGTGGHLAALLATDSPELPGVERWRFAGRPDLAILGHPLVELRDSFVGRIANPDADRAVELLGEDVEPELLEHLSAATRVTSPKEEAMPSLFLWAATEDAELHPLHTVSLMTSLAVAGVPFEGHVFASAAEEEQWRGLLTRWLDESGWLG